MTKPRGYPVNKISQNITCLAVAEGRTEETFLKYIKSHFCTGANTSLSVHCTYGGGPTYIVKKAIVQKNTAAFDRAIAVFDSKEEKNVSSLEKRGRKNGLLVAISVPCIEMTYLSILNPMKYRPGYFTDATKCKRYFQKKYLGIKYSPSEQIYSKLFPKKLLRERRNVVPVLDKIITFFEN